MAEPGFVSGSTSAQLKFSFTYACDKVERLTASGMYSRAASSLSALVSYTFNRDIVVNGETLSRRFTLQLTIEARNVSETSVQPFKQKEDILKFLRRVVDDIFEKGRQDGLMVSGVVFSPEDLMDIAGIDNGRFLKLVHELIMAAAMLARMRQAQTHEKLHPIVLTPRREVTQGVQAQASEERSLDVHITLEEVADGGIEGDARSQSTATDDVSADQHSGANLV